MRLVHLFAGRRRETLDAVVAGAKEDGAQQVDEYVKTRVDALRLSARALVEDAAAVAVAIKIG